MHVVVDVERLQRELEAIVGPRRMSMRAIDLDTYARDMWPRLLLAYRDGVKNAPRPHAPCEAQYDCALRDVRHGPQPRDRNGRAAAGTTAAVGTLARRCARIYTPHRAARVTGAGTARSARAGRTSRLASAQRSGQRQPVDAHGLHRDGADAGPGRQLAHPFAQVPRRDPRRVGSIAGGARRTDAGLIAIAPAR